MTVKFSLGTNLQQHLGTWLTFTLSLLLTACTQTPSTPTALASYLVTDPTPSRSSTLMPTSTQTLTPRPTPVPVPTQTPTFTPSPTTTLLPTTPSFQSLTKAVVLIIIDGARWSETFGDPTYELIPHLANDLAPLGAINTTFYNDGITVTVPGHAAIATGAWQDISNDGRMRPTVPTIFEYYRAATGASEDDVIFVHGSFIEPVLTYSTHPAYGAKFGARQFFSDYPTPPYDDGMWVNAQRVLAEVKPHLLMVSLLDPDEAAHVRDWEGYRQAIKHDDEIIRDLWQQLQADPFYAGQTTLMITNDHGRGCGDGWPEHGGDDECNRHVMFLAVGPDIQQGLVVTQRRTLRDIAPTIGYLLGLETSFAEGEVMTELLMR